ncbi:MAG: hypothetical protein H0U21_02650, partial [Acidimicrobiia bacterium]|nr:hypothetical protein [Acidimicrobiia bacterium]
MDDAPPAASTTDRWWRRPDPMWLVAAVAVLPIVVHVVRYLVDGAAPIGDAAYFTVRSVDVGTRHHPLLGAWSSGSAALTAPVNNLGPLQLDLLAPFTKVAPFAGTFVGIAAMNAAAVVGVGAAARRVGGRGMAMVALATISVVTWSLGSFLLVDARQQHALMLPFGCLLFLCWVVTAGDRAAAPFAVLTGSLIVQTHLSYLFPVVAVAVTTVTVAVIGWWRSRRAVDPPASTRWYVGPTAISVVVLAVCWVQPLIDQLWGRGNMRNLLGAADEGKPGPGLGRGLRILATVLTDPSAWGREGFARFDPAFRLVGTGRAA